MNKIVVIKATWCGPCKIYGPIVEAATEDIKAKGFDVEFIDADKDPDFCQRYNVRGIPSTLIFKDDVLTKTLVGSQSKENILKELF